MSVWENCGYDSITTLFSIQKCCQNCPYLELEVDEGRNVVPMQQQPVCSGSNDVRKALEDANKLNRSQQVR